jgi:hypothetical protein
MVITLRTRNNTDKVPRHRKIALPQLGGLPHEDIQKDIFHIPLKGWEGVDWIHLAADGTSGGLLWTPFHNV